jgi:serine/threonine protein phosphatase PrpC
VNSNLRDRLFHLLEKGTSTRSVEAAPGLALGSVKGPVRKENQDRAFVARISRGDMPQSLIVAAVLDGMGGMEEGGRAAAIAASAFIADLVISQGLLADRLNGAVHAANSQVYDRFHARGGTTLTALAFNERQEGCVVHVGDTRLYHRSPTNLIRVTTDDTVQGVVQAGGIANEEEELDSQLIQFVGIGSDIEPHLIDIHDNPGAIWLLTSDGAHGMGRGLLQGINGAAGSVGDLTRKIIFVADAAGVTDNATVAAIQLAGFEALRPFHNGVTLEVWTPTSHLEIWLDHVQAIGRPLEGLAESPSKEKPFGRAPAVAKPKNKRKQTPKAGSKTRAIEKAPEHPASDEVPGPQLNISFGHGSAEGD